MAEQAIFTVLVMVSDGSGNLLMEDRNDPGWPGICFPGGHVEPGEAFTYTSGAVLETAVGTMQGSYRMSGDDGTEFDAPIPAFTLAVPRTLH